MYGIELCNYNLSPNVGIIGRKIKMRYIHFLGTNVWLGTYFASFNVQVMNEDELHVFLVEKILTPQGCQDLSK
jgi:hypothetical protein